MKELKNRSNILTLFDVFTTKNNTYLITELCSSDMNKIIKAKLTEPEAYFYMAQLLEGYKEIYQQFFKVNIPRNCSEMTMDRQEALLEGLHDLRQLISRIHLLRYCRLKLNT